jgi:crotonobetainyl-CoA:carnitine CoA-transferase CaiB-like acyl-CoA transferase
MILADLGAEVIKVEHPDPMKDMARISPPFITGERSRVGSLFYQINRNKKSVSLDYTKPEGRDIFLKLIETADVLVDSFKPGTMDHYDLGRDVLERVNPDLIYCSVSGYGQDGPRAGEPGHDMNYLALAGVLSMAGEPVGSPMPLPIPFADYIGGLYSAIGVISALVRHGCRNRPGARENGFVLIDASIFESAMSLLHFYNSNPMTGRPNFEKGEDVLSGWHPFYRLFKCKDGKYLSLGAIEQKFWDNLLDAIGHPELKAEQFSGNTYVVDELHLKPAVDVAEITALLEATFLERDRDDWVSFLAAHDVCCTPVNDLSQAWADGHVQARGMLIEVADPRYGTKRHIGFPVKINDERPPIFPAPDPGQDNEEILGALEIDAEQLVRLKRKHVV